MDNITGDTIISINSDPKAKLFTVKVEFILTKQGAKNTQWFDKVFTIKKDGNAILLERDMTPFEPNPKKHGKEKYKNVTTTEK